MVHHKLSALFLALACLAAPAIAADHDFDSALQSYRSGRMSDAYGRMLALGLRGDPDAARVALFLGQQGTMLYGASWELTEADAQVLRKAAMRPSLRPQVQPEATGYDATGTRQWPVAPEKLATK